METELKVCVLGYGAPKYPLYDGNNGHYLFAMLKTLERLKPPSVDLYLAGGHTTRLDLSEAEAMKIWLDHYRLPDYCTVRLLEKGVTTNENLINFKEAVGDTAVVIFCEHSLKDVVNFLASKLFKRFIIYGIEFDERKKNVWHRLKQSTWRLWLEEAAWHSKRVEQFRQWLKARQLKHLR